MSGYSKRQDEDYFDDENEDVLETDWDEYPDLGNLPDFEDLDPDQDRRNRNSRKSGI